MSICYLSKKDIEQTGILENQCLPLVWNEIKMSLELLGHGEATAPLDLYLRPRKEGYVDRIIAKASFLGNRKAAGTEIAGLKWIASAPLNITKGLPRANGLIILNDPYTGQIIAIMDAAPINALRTAAVSVIALKELKPTFGKLVIFGGGVIGAEHLRQVLEAGKQKHFPRLSEIQVYDAQEPKSTRLVEEYQATAVERNIDLRPASSLMDCFTNDTATIIATNAIASHLGKDTVEGKSDLVVVHVSLRDYYPEALPVFDSIVVDSWERVAREGTTVELAYKKGLINRDSCVELIKYLAEKPGDKHEGNMIINPMGISVTDLAMDYLFTVAQ
jgi:N-[(2S)-2-amino-2-carboxyethyl]-L-glutamate dehydrogenase